MAASPRISPVWTFGKLNPQPTDTGPNVLTLGGWQAPFGRPRNGAIFNAGLSVNRTRTNYPGKGVPPTIHTFGSTLKPIDVHGRWMDQAIAQVGGAQQYIKDWKAFVDDQRVVRVTWGGIISYQIFIHDMDMNMEGPGDVAWRMQAETLVDDQLPVYNTNPPSTQTPFDMATEMAKIFPQAIFPTGFISPSLGAMLSQITDAIGTLISQLNTPFQFIYNTCDAITTFETAISSDLSSLQSGIATMQTGIINLRNNTDFLLSSAVELNQPGSSPLTDVSGGIITAADMTSLVANKQTSDYAASQMLLLMAQMESQVYQAQRGSGQSAYIAKAGDTWEQVAENVLGNADGARSIKAYNGIRYGELPNPGQQYTIPKH